MFGYHDVTDDSDDAMQQPLCWITNDFDRSPAELLWVDSERWGPFQGTLLNLSYGYGRVYLVPHETVGTQIQGGMVQLPLPDTPTGLIRGRFSPADGQLYTCGMFAWAGNQDAPGGFYRVRYLDKPAYLPLQLKAHAAGVDITFSEPLDAAACEDTQRYRIETWDLRPHGQLWFASSQRTPAEDRGSTSAARRTHRETDTARDSADLVHGNRLHDHGYQRGKRPGSDP